MSKLYSYIVRFDSGFAPNPFYGYCTLATCKPQIRKNTNIGDWIIGCGSNAKGIKLGGNLVYAMQVSEILSFEEYSTDFRFESKKPFRKGSRKQSCGDNIYFRDDQTGHWLQRDSFHSLSNGAQNQEHTNKDTRVNRVLVSQNFIYFGSTGPSIPDYLTDENGRHICHTGIGLSRFDDENLIKMFVQWYESFHEYGYQGAPHEWTTLRKKWHQ